MRLELALLIIILSISTSVHGATYPTLEKDDSYKIPYCLNQVGHRCKVCGPIKDLNDTTKVVPTAPNALETACLISTKGCSAFNDLKGEECQGNCLCGFNKDHWDNCIPRVIENCRKLDPTGKKCVECVTQTGDYNTGGGNNDYGQSYDKKTCVSNLATGFPKCLKYQKGDLVCATCQTGYYLTSQFKCIQLAVGKTATTGCFQYNPEGTRCEVCKRPGKLNIEGTQCTNYNTALDDDSTCLRKSLDGSVCLQCPLGSFFNGVKCSSSLTAKTSIILSDGAEDIEQTGQEVGQSGKFTGDCAIYDLYYYTQLIRVPICLVKKSDNLVKTILEQIPKVSQSTNVVSDEFGCNDWDPVNLNCQSETACQKDITYDKSIKQCLNYEYDCTPSNCLVAENQRECVKCQNGFHLVEQHCQKNPDYITENCVEWESGTLKCTRCDTNYKLNSEQNICEDMNTLFPNCHHFNETGCEMCKDNYTLDESSQQCDLTVTETPGGVYGCYQHEADEVCSVCFEHFELSADKKTCTPQFLKVHSNDQDSFCAEFDANRNCLLCNQIDYILHQNGNNPTICIQKSNGGYCELTYDGCNCVTCQQGFQPNQDNGVCEMTGGSPNINGCIKYKSKTECEKCSIGYLLTTDKQCYSLHYHRISIGGQDINVSGASINVYADQVTAPCLKAKSETECEDCAVHSSIGHFSHVQGSVTYSFCFYNVFSKTIKLDTQEAHRIQHCQQYVIADPIDSKKCQACHDGFELANSGNLCIVKAVRSEQLKCQDYDLTTDKCTSCNAGYQLGSQSCLIPTFSQTGKTLPHACQKYVGEKCEECMNGWTLDSFTDSGNGRCISNYQGDVDGTACFVKTGEENCLTTTFKVIAANKYEPTACVQGSKLVQVQCEIDTGVAENHCTKVNSITGACQQCAEGYVNAHTDYDLDANPANPKWTDFSGKQFWAYEQFCVKAVKDCIQYDLSVGYKRKCLECKPNADGLSQVPDGSNRNCITSLLQNGNCDSFAEGDTSKCVKCQSDTGDLTNNCQTPQNCSQYNNMTQECTKCRTGFLLSSSNKCIIYSGPEGCQIPYSETLCAECKKDDYTMIPGIDNDVSDAFGHCVKRVFAGCLIADSEHQECVRCQFGEYALVDGVCIKNDGSNSFPKHCITYAYNTTSQQVFCDECDLGFGISPDRSRCLINSGTCVDSVESDCYLYQPFGEYEKTLACESFDRPSFGSVIIFTKAFAFIFFAAFLFVF